MGKFVAFGEIMLRLSPPGRQLLLQSPSLDVWVAGAEANVAIQLARLGHDVGFVSALPDNDLGEGALTALRGHGVDVSGIRRGGTRIGLYFVTSGAGMRATEVIYDRAHSSFAETPTDAWDWDALLAGRTGCTCRASPPRSAPTPRMPRSPPPKPQPRAACRFPSTATGAGNCGSGGTPIRAAS